MPDLNIMAALVCHLRVEDQIATVKIARMPLAVVTCGPAYEPIDKVRRITNQSTGELGSLLSETLARANFEVLCLRGEMAVYPKPQDVNVVPFTTNASLLALLERLPMQPAAVFHAAALCDFLVHEIEGSDRERKIPSSVSELRLILRPAEKLLPRLRAVVSPSDNRRVEIRARGLARRGHCPRSRAGRLCAHQCLRRQWHFLRRRLRLPGARQRKSTSP